MIYSIVWLKCNTQLDNTVNNNTKDNNAGSITFLIVYVLQDKLCNELFNYHMIVSLESVLTF